jgi:hypothetical protein
MLLRVKMAYMRVECTNMAQFSTVSLEAVKRGRGRPKGSTNKAKKNADGRTQLEIRLGIQGLEYQLLFPHAEDVKARYERELAYWCTQLTD